MPEMKRAENKSRITLTALIGIILFGIASYTLANPVNLSGYVKGGLFVAVFFYFILFIYLAKKTGWIG
jgi:hypothetical protein